MHWLNILWSHVTKTGNTTKHYPQMSYVLFIIFVYHSHSLGLRGCQSPVIVGNPIMSTREPYSSLLSTVAMFRKDSTHSNTQKQNTLNGTQKSMLDLWKFHVNRESRKTRLHKKGLPRWLRNTLEIRFCCPCHLWDWLSFNKTGFCFMIHVGK